MVVDKNDCKAKKGKMMQELLKPKTYPMEVRKAIYSQSSLGVAIANRWMLGWPQRVKALIDNGDYQEAFLKQAEVERQALAEATGMNHLADHEKLAMLEIMPAPPLI